MFTGILFIGEGKKSRNKYRKPSERRRVKLPGRKKERLEKTKEFKINVGFWTTKDEVKEL